MRLFLLPDSFNGSDEIIFTGKEYNYVVKVLRLKENASITGRDKDGNTWNLTILSISNNMCRLSAVKDNVAKSTTDSLPEDRPTRNIILYQCLPKGRKLDEIIKRATETGVRTIVPVKSRNCIASVEGKEESRLERYQAMVKEAVQQSGSLVPTAVEKTIDIKNIAEDFKKRCISFNEEGKGFILHQCKIKEKQKNLVSSLKDFKGTVAILVGPEGGFTDTECQMMIENGFDPILLKSNILRCETAAIYAVAVVQTILES